MFCASKVVTAGVASRRCGTCSCCGRTTRRRRWVCQAVSWHSIVDRARSYRVYSGSKGSSSQVDANELRYSSIGRQVAKFHKVPGWVHSYCFALEMVLESQDLSYKPEKISCLRWDMRVESDHLQKITYQMVLGLGSHWLGVKTYAVPEAVIA